MTISRRAAGIAFSVALFCAPAVAACPVEVAPIAELIKRSVCLPCAGRSGFEDEDRAEALGFLVAQLAGPRHSTTDAMRDCFEAAGQILLLSVPAAQRGSYEAGRTRATLDLGHADLALPPDPPLEAIARSLETALAAAAETPAPPREEMTAEEAIVGRWQLAELTKPDGQRRVVDVEIAYRFLADGRLEIIGLGVVVPGTWRVENGQLHVTTTLEEEDNTSILGIEFDRTGPERLVMTETDGVRAYFVRISDQ